MELPSLINKVLLKCAPMTAMENEKISNGCKLWYEKLIASTKTKVDSDAPLSLVDKLVLQLDQWYVQLIFAASYFFIIQFIQNLMNPEGDETDDNLPS